MKKIFTALFVFTFIASLPFIAINLILLQFPDFKADTSMFSFCIFISLIAATIASYLTLIFYED